MPWVQSWTNDLLEKWCPLLQYISRDFQRIYARSVLEVIGSLWYFVTPRKKIVTHLYIT